MFFLLELSNKFMNQTKTYLDNKNLNDVEIVGDDC